MYKRTGDGWRICTGNGMISSVFRPNPTIPIPIKACHRLLREQSKGLLEDIEMVITRFCSHDFVVRSNER